MRGGRGFVLNKDLVDGVEFGLLAFFAYGLIMLICYSIDESRKKNLKYPDKFE